MKRGYAVMTGHPHPEFLALQQALAGRYSLEREIGRGGMGVVFLARDVALERLVAIKLLPPHLATSEFRERFLREARTAAKLSHPHIVAIHLVEAQGDLVYFVMSYVEGESLGQRIRRGGPLPPAQVGRIVQEVAWALAYAHQQSVVHRDIKPDNILIEGVSGRSLVTDFGIARLLDARTVTAQGELVGTVHYMSPEQLMDEPVDGRSDLYALGVTAHYALTGRLPFEGSNMHAVIQKHVSAPAPRLAQVLPGIPPRLAEIVDRCLAKRPDERFTNAEALAEALRPETAAPVVVPAIRVLLHHVRAMGIVGVSALVLGTWLAETNQLQLLLNTGADGLAVIALLWGALRLRRLTRRALQDGIDHPELRRALLAEGRARLEEMQWLRKEETPTSFFVLGGYAIVMTLMLARRGTATGAIGAACGSVVSYFWIRELVRIRRLKRDPMRALDSPPTIMLSLAERFLAGPPGQLLFELDYRSYEAKRRKTSDAARTEIVLRQAAQKLYEDLPSDMRRRLPDVRGALDNLEKHVAVLRREEESLSRAIAQAAPAASPREWNVAVAELASARDDVRRRLEHAVAVLEGIRLDLLRLHAGLATPDDLTADVARAAEIGGAIDVVLRGIEQARSSSDRRPV